MGAYLTRRLLVAIPSLLGISLVLFVVLALAPGDPFSELATNPSVPPEVRLALRAKFGLDDPVLLRYWHWLLAMAQGDWGFSFQSRTDVAGLILGGGPTTLVVIGESDRDASYGVTRRLIIVSRPGDASIWTTWPSDAATALNCCVGVEFSATRCGSRAWGVSPAARTC